MLWSFELDHGCGVITPAEDVLDFFDSLLLPQVRIFQSLHHFGFKQLQLFGFSILLGDELRLIPECFLLLPLLRFEFRHQVLLLTDLASLRQYLLFESLLLSPPQIQLFLLYYHLFVFACFLSNGGCISHPLFFKLFNFCSCDRGLGSFFLDEVASTIESNRFLFLALAHHLLLLELVF